MFSPTVQPHIYVHLCLVPFLGKTGDTRYSDGWCRLFVYLLSGSLFVCLVLRLYAGADMWFAERVIFKRGRWMDVE